MEKLLNPLETVQLIPIFSYLNILSDILYSERFLEEIDQNKRIPVVNALYEYLHVNRFQQLKTAEFVRNVMKGSDLYGAEEDECLDVTFVNAMFDYIISSLVFEKYGNVYGFLASIFVETDNLLIYEILNLVRRNLGDAQFENEYGEKSNLSSLAVGRIYNDIILPMFPLSDTNLTLLSLDYIYAQAGSMFLRGGKRNTAYYKDSVIGENNVFDKTLFEQYSVTGYVLEKMILNQKKNVNLLKAFALPALSNYIFSKKFLFAYQKMGNVVLDHSFWQAAYMHLFHYTSKIHMDIEGVLKNDYTLQMHIALSNLKNCETLAEIMLEQRCPQVGASEKDKRLFLYLHFPQTFFCRNDSKLLPIPKENFLSHINSIMDLYELHDLPLIKRAFPTDLQVEFQNSNVFINLLVPNITLEYSHFFREEYDFLEVYYPRFSTIYYYTLKRDDYNITLINFEDNKEISSEEVKSSFDRLKKISVSKILKRSDDNITVFFHNFVEYKKARLKFYLNSFDNCAGTMNKEINKNWWKEFGLSLVPYSSCLTEKCGNECQTVCTSDKIKLFYKYPNEVSSKLLNTSTQSYLDSLGTRMKSVFFRNVSGEAVDKFVAKENGSKSLMYTLNGHKIFEDISLNLPKSSFRLTFAAKDDLVQFEKVINSLVAKTNFTFTTIVVSLKEMGVLMSSTVKGIGKTGTDGKRQIYATTLENRTYCAYGYKFIYTSDNAKFVAQLKTDSEFKIQRFVQIVETKENGEKVYSYFDNNLDQVPNFFFYEINNQLWSKEKRVEFSGVSIIYDGDDNCKDRYYAKNLDNIHICRRKRRYLKKIVNDEEIVDFVWRLSSHPLATIRAALDQHLFPNDQVLNEYFTEWAKNPFVEPQGGENYRIENPNLLNDLRYEISFESQNITDYLGEHRINAFYSPVERARIEKGASIESTIEKFNVQQARFSVTFHDYYAIRNFLTAGYKRISADTNEAKFMKMALYKLAIRQSDDPIGVFEMKLYFAESKPTAFLKIKTEEFIVLQKFTQAFVSGEAALRFVGRPAPGYVNILYEIEFSDRYFRAKVEQVYETREESVILLPGSEFLLQERYTVNPPGLGLMEKIVLKSQASVHEKIAWYQNIMNEITRFDF